VPHALSDAQKGERVNTFYLIVPCSAFEVFEVLFIISELFIADASQVRPARVSDPLSRPI
jgi:hypothetical protein